MAATSGVAQSGMPVTRLPKVASWKFSSRLTLTRRGRQTLSAGDRNEGAIRERSPGHWAIVIDVRDSQTGKRKRRWHSFEGTKRQAQIECARLVSELQHGGAIEPSRITVGQFLDRFERDWLATHVTARSA